jgi:hypothetical protein
MALYGAVVYLTLSQTFLGFTESEGGPTLLRSLPIRNLTAFRIGTEKAFHVGLLLPVLLALALALAAAALCGRGFSLPLALGHALFAGLFAVALCSLLFEHERGLAFSEVDRGVYPADLGRGPMIALLLGVLAALFAVEVVQNAFGFLAGVVALAAAIRVVYAWKRRRWTTAC